nr:MAG TPA: hypothetical protein [Caudoviricetes sp.]
MKTTTASESTPDGELNLTTIKPEKLLSLISLM